MAAWLACRMLFVLSIGSVSCPSVHLFTLQAGSVKVRVSKGRHLGSDRTQHREPVCRFMADFSNSAHHDLTVARASVSVGGDGGG